MEYSGIILSGGKSSRMGTNKCLLKKNNKTFIDLQIEKLKPFCSEIYISTSQKNTYNYKNIIVDNYSEIGAISGIYSSLKQIKTDLAIFLPCDMPNLSAKAIEKLSDSFNNSYDAVISVHKKKQYPVFSIYSKKCLQSLEEQIKNKDYKLLNFIDKIKILYLDFNNDYSKDFANINTFDDYNNFIKWQ